jgi:glycosyltransferase involved in cell wall biosynthesis
MTVAVLTPVRNGARELPEFMAMLEPLADAFVAIDDGSTDETWELLTKASVPTVALRPPRGPIWDDGANRQALLDAAGAIRPDWILFLDVDERIDADDAASLRSFLEADALAGCAYGLQHCRIWDGRYDPAFSWVYRLFAWAPDQRLPSGRLHFNPVPLSIARERFIRTTIRLQHLDSPRRLHARVDRYADADPGSTHGGARHGGLDVPPSGELREWGPRDPSMPVLAPANLEPEREPAAPLDPPPQRELVRERPQLAVLVPVRDAQEDLPGYLESARRLTDTVIALDDGSSDASAEILRQSELVRVLIRNKRADGAWDDATNRQALLDAAAALEPRWILFLDADERISSDDAQALLGFLAGDAVPGFAYGMRVCRMVEDLEHFDRDALIAYRLFAWERGQTLPRRRLHPIPIPESIDRVRWLQTTLRIQHLGSLTDARRRARHAKYRTEDPGHEFQDSYAQLLDPPQQIRRFETRPRDQPVLADPPQAPHDLDGPALSAIVIARDDADRIEDAVRAVLEQEMPEPFEVIVVVSGSPHTAALVRERFGEDVRLVELREPVLPGAARNAGLRLARGEFVSFPGSHVRIEPGSLAARLRAHRAGAAMVTGSIVNGTNTRAGWASYFIDHADALPGRPSGELAGAPAHCSYMRHHLEQVGGFPEDLRAGEDTVVNQELYRRGYRARRVQEIALVHRSRCETIPRLLEHHFQRGRALGRILAAEGVPVRKRLEHLRRYVPRRMRYIDGGVGLWGGELRSHYESVRPLVRAGVQAAWSGYFLELLSSARR